MDEQTKKLLLLVLGSQKERGSGRRGSERRGCSGNAYHPHAPYGHVPYGHAYQLAPAYAMPVLQSYGAVPQASFGIKHPPPVYAGYPPEYSHNIYPPVYPGYTISHAGVSTGKSPANMTPVTRPVDQPNPSTTASSQAVEDDFENLKLSDSANN